MAAFEGIFGILSGWAPTAPVGRWKVREVGGDLPAVSMLSVRPAGL